jgi:hypothetical protein
MTDGNNARYFDDFIAANGCKEVNAGTCRLGYAVAVNKSDQLNAAVADGSNAPYFDDFSAANAVNAGTCRLD